MDFLKGLEMRDWEGSALDMVASMASMASSLLSTTSLSNLSLRAHIGGIYVKGVSLAGLSLFL